MGDAESGRLPGSGSSRDYYDGYYFACAVNYEYIGRLPEAVGEGDLICDSAALPISGFDAQLLRLNSQVSDSQDSRLPSGDRNSAGEHLPVSGSSRQTPCR